MFVLKEMGNIQRGRGQWAVYDSSTQSSIIILFVGLQIWGLLFWLSGSLSWIFKHVIQCANLAKVTKLHSFKVNLDFKGPKNQLNLKKVNKQTIKMF